MVSLRETPRMTCYSPQDSQEPAAEGSPAGGVDAWPKKTEKEPVDKVASGPGKEKLKAGASGFPGGRGDVGGWVWTSMGVGDRCWAGSLDLGGRVIACMGLLTGGCLGVTGCNSVGCGSLC